MIPSIRAWTPSENVKSCNSSFIVASTPTNVFPMPLRISGSVGDGRESSTRVTWHQPATHSLEHTLQTERGNPSYYKLNEVTMTKAGFYSETNKTKMKAIHH